MHIAWACVSLAGMFEVAWPFAMKWADKYGKIGPIVISIIWGFPVGWLMGKALEVLPASTAYAVLVGIGGIGTTIFGIMVMNEPSSWPRLCSMALVVAGVVGLKLFTPA
jgi:quaternary ammonium compound-resistance protein SugE